MLVLCRDYEHLKGKRMPVWVMRQAGRYMEEFQKIRQKYSFFDLCDNPEACRDVTLMVILLKILLILFWIQANQKIWSWCCYNILRYFASLQYIGFKIRNDSKCWPILQQSCKFEWKNKCVDSKWRYWPEAKGSKCVQSNSLDSKIFGRLLPSDWFHCSSCNQLVLIFLRVAWSCSKKDFCAQICNSVKFWKICSWWPEERPTIGSKFFLVLK